MNYLLTLDTNLVNDMIGVEVENIRNRKKVCKKMNDIIIGLDKSLKENDDEEDDYYCWNSDRNFVQNFFTAYEAQSEFLVDEGVRELPWGHYCCIYPLS